jgi:hypothetical protein
VRLVSGDHRIVGKPRTRRGSGFQSTQPWVPSALRTQGRMSMPTWKAFLGRKGRG